MKVLVIPDIHLKPWIFDKAQQLMQQGAADKAVCLMDIADDFGKQNDSDLYSQTYDRAIRFAKEYPDTLWCYGNHDLSYLWGKPETGYNPAMRELVCAKLDQLRTALPDKNQLAIVHKIDNCLFLHGGLCTNFVKLFVCESYQKSISKTIAYINSLADDDSTNFWHRSSPIWLRPQTCDDFFVKQSIFRYNKYLQVVGHTPVKDVVLQNSVLSCDTFSTYRDGTPYGSQRFCVVNTGTKTFQTYPGV